MPLTTYTATLILTLTAQRLISPIPEIQTLLLLLLYLTASLLSVTYLLLTHPFSSTVYLYITHNTLFIITCITSTLLTRIFFSPLSHIPGPFWAKTSKLWAANEFFHGRHARTLKELHERYGDVVRVGPWEVSVRNVDAITEVYKKGYRRGTFYESGTINGAVSLNTTRDNAAHAVWRRIWEKAFVSSEFKEYNPRVERHIQILIDVLEKGEGKDVDISKLMDNLVFDIMADLCFAKDSKLQTGEGDTSYMDFIHKYMNIVGVVGALRNLSHLLLYLPYSSDLLAFRAKGDSMLLQRQTLGTSRKDIFRHLLAEDDQTQSKFSQAELNSNANMVIVAGSDTTASTLAQIFGVLASDERVLGKLQREIDSLGEKAIDSESVKGLEYLNGVVNEALRLYNPIPSGIQACTPPSGMEIGGVKIPGNIQISIPHLVLMTDERWFERAEEFLPERWCDEGKGMVRDKRAFIPFGVGAHACVGRQLALNEMRLVIARVVGRWRIKRGEGWDSEAMRREWKDYMVVQIGSIWVRFLERGRG